MPDVPTRDRYLAAQQILRQWDDLSVAAQPVLRWAGGKRYFAMRWPQLFKHPANRRWIEPFFGSGAPLFAATRWAQTPIPSVVGDANRPLIEFYLGLREDPDAVYKEMTTLASAFEKDPHGTYHGAREQLNAQLPSVSPGLFVFINRTCWNGLFRINSYGRFNVPMGRLPADRTTFFPSRQALWSAAAALARTQIRAATWQNTVDFAEAGDFVFLDPPYFSDHLRGSSATKYGKESFALAEHELLAAACQRLSDQNSDFLLCNSAEEELVDLYSQYPFNVYAADMPRSINSVSSDRSGAQELLVSNIALNVDAVRIRATQQHHHGTNATADRPHDLIGVIRAVKQSA